MAIPHDTDEHLKQRPDSSQQRERLCAAILSLDKRFSRITLRLPRGGPDQGRDIEAVFEDHLLAFGAVSFVNGANDSPTQRRQIRQKFRKDLKSALTHRPDLDVFLFFTNIDLTSADREELTSHASVTDRLSIEIFHRERIRQALDSPSGFAFRHQYLDLPMSDAEQATFFAEFGSDLQNVIAQKFMDVGRSLERIEFFADKASPLIWLQGIITLDRPYAPSSLSPFRVLLEFRRRGSRSANPQFSIAVEDTCWAKGSGHRFGTRLYVGTRQQAVHDLKHYFQTPTVQEILLGCELAPGPAIPTLGSLDQNEISVFMNASLAERLENIYLTANVYEVGRIEKKDVHIGSIGSPPWWPDNPVWPELGPSAKSFSWVELSRATGLLFPEYLPNVPWLIDFYRQTPRRLHP